MAHERTDVVRTYEFTHDEIRVRLGIGGEIVGFGRSDDGVRLVVTSSMIHPEDSRFGAPLIEGEVCRWCGAGGNQQHAANCLGTESQPPWCPYCHAGQAAPTEIGTLIMVCDAHHTLARPAGYVESVKVR